MTRSQEENPKGWWLGTEPAEQVDMGARYLGDLNANIAAGVPVVPMAFSSVEDIVVASQEIVENGTVELGIRVEAERICGAANEMLGRYAAVIARDSRNIEVSTDRAA